MYQMQKPKIINRCHQLRVYEVGSTHRIRVAVSLRGFEDSRHHGIFALFYWAYYRFFKKLYIAVSITDEDYNIIKSSELLGIRTGRREVLLDKIIIIPEKPGVYRAVVTLKMQLNSAPIIMVYDTEIIAVRKGIKIVYQGVR